MGRCAGLAAEVRHLNICIYPPTDTLPLLPKLSLNMGVGVGSPCSLLGGSTEALWTQMQMHRGNYHQALPAKPSCYLRGSAEAGPVYRHSIHARTWTEQHLKHKPEQTALICLNPKMEPNLKLLFLETASNREPQLQKHQEKSLNQTLRQERCLKSISQCESATASSLCFLKLLNPLLKTVAYII